MVDIPLTWIGSLAVFLVAMARFNDPVPVAPRSLSNMHSWTSMVRSWFRWHSDSIDPLYIPPRASTTVFKYRVYQMVYALIALMIYWLFINQPEVLVRVQKIIIMLGEAAGLEDTAKYPFLGESGPLLIAAFVLLVLPNVPPFKGADQSIRRTLYRRASIPAQQLREMNRLLKAPYMPPEQSVKTVRTELLAEGFYPEDIEYNPDMPTTQSLWTKCTVLIHEIKGLEADEDYKTAFAIILEPNTNERSVESVKAHYRALMSDAKACFTALREPGAENDAEVVQRTESFRVHCKELLEMIYRLLSRISLHAHYSDKQRSAAMQRIGFQLTPDEIGPLPDANEVIALILILAVVLVTPLSTVVGILGALVVGGIIFTAVLTPIVMAGVCPRIAVCNTRYVPPIAFPFIAACVAALLGVFIMTAVGYLIPATNLCNFTGFERYTQCSYPWSFLHAAMAALIAWRMLVGEYPDSKALTGIKRYQLWGSFKDAAIFLAVMLVLLVSVVIPELTKLGRVFEGIAYPMVLVRVGLVSAVLGFFVPTWYRAHRIRRSTDRRIDLRTRQKFDEYLKHG